MEDSARGLHGQNGRIAQLMMKVIRTKLKPRLCTSSSSTSMRLAGYLHERCGLDFLFLCAGSSQPIDCKRTNDSHQYSDELLDVKIFGLWMMRNQCARGLLRRYEEIFGEGAADAFGRF